MVQRKRRTGSELFAQQLEQYLKSLPNDKKLRLSGPGTSEVKAWFLGPKAENQEIFRDLVARAVDEHCDDRREIYATDPIYVTEADMDEETFKQAMAELEKKYGELLTELKHSVPFTSYRYQAHMNYDLTMPGMLGYFAAMLYNPNNVAAEASPVTTLLEMQVGKDLCRMLGYHVPSRQDLPSTELTPWGHITADGSIANLEAMWATRNIKYYPIAVAEAIKQGVKEGTLLAQAKDTKVKLLDGQEVVLINRDAWTLLNIQVDEVLTLPLKVKEEIYGPSKNGDTSIPQDITNAINACSLQVLGFIEFSRRYLYTRNEDGQIVPIHAPKLLITATAHYSWPKATTVLGLGTDSVVSINVDLNARMDLDALRAAIEKCYLNKYPVIMTVAVIGSTEESAVDPLSGVVALREEYRQKGFEFYLHADAAWGGYFASILREDKHETLAKSGKREYTPEMTMSEYVNEQYEALPYTDSITVDPHKAGYIPYPAGALCYRNSATRNIVSFEAPVVYHGGVDPTVGIYGIEGSKPGAAAAGVYLSHSVIRPDRSGYGRILGKALFNSKCLYSSVITMAQESDPFIIVPLQMIPAEREGQSPEAIKAQLAYIKHYIANRTNEEILEDPEVMKLFRQLGSDQVIISYAFNFKDQHGQLNKDLDLLNQLNMNLYRRLSITSIQDSDNSNGATKPIIVTQSTFDPSHYGQSFVDTFKKRLGVEGGSRTGNEGVNFLLSTTMSPILTETSEGSMIPTIVEEFRQVVIEEVKKLTKSGAPTT